MQTIKLALHFPIINNVEIPSCSRIIMVELCLLHVRSLVPYYYDQALLVSSRYGMVAIPFRGRDQSSGFALFHNILELPLYLKLGK